MIDLTIYPDRLERAVKRARERNIIIPTYKQMKETAAHPCQNQGRAERESACGM